LEDREAFGRVRRVCPACGLIVFRDHKVAAGVLATRAGRVLLVRRAIEPAQGLWSFPAGFVDFDEDPAEAAVRECLEETSVRVEITRLLDVVSGREHERGADLVIVYCAHALDGEPRPGDDAEAAAYFAPDALPPLAFRSTEVALAHWRRGQCDRSKE
jgi:ADP-ribose pyrophosphatase YjhB (NUDIX family)